MVTIYIWKYASIYLQTWFIYAMLYRPRVALLIVDFVSALIVILLCLTIPTPIPFHHPNHPNMICMLIPCCVGCFLSWVLFLWGLGFWGWYCPACQPRYLFCWQVTVGREALGDFMAIWWGISYLVRCSPTGRSGVPYPALLSIWRGVWWRCPVCFCFGDCLMINCG